MADIVAPVCTPHAFFFGFGGIALAVAFSNVGAAYGTAKAGLGIAASGCLRPDLVMKALIPVVMAGILGIYGLITGVMLKQNMSPYDEYSLFQGYAHLAAGLTVGFCSIASGYAIGLTGDIGVRCHARQPRLFVGMMIVQTFASALGLYGLIIGMVVSMTKGKGLCRSWNGE
eukprot:GHVH01004229.1.p1 GENE.GHVH01004229.1~~GHVH01004229.1.p1  ORF type:complete len:172 (+),score=9.68 GHVH01004229.1:137-652(+)